MTTSIVHTTYSTYEVDVENRRIRRLQGDFAPTKNQPADGFWRSYQKLEWFGESMLITWGWDDESVLRRTRTSHVSKVEGPALNLLEYGMVAK